MKTEKKPARLIPRAGLTQTQRKSLGLLGGFVPRERKENEAGPRTDSWKTAGKLTGADLAMTPVRPGAEDHKQYKSFGLRV